MENKPPTKLPLWQLIFQTHRRSTFVPVILVTTALLTLYFGANSYLTSSYQATLFEQVQQSFSQMVRLEAEKITLQLQPISRVARILQEEHTRFFNSSAPISLPFGEPEFATASNGIFFKTRNNGGSSLFYGRRTRVTAAELAKARSTEVFDPLFKAIQSGNPLIVAIYFNSFDQMNRYYPFIPDVTTQYDPDLRMQEYNFYYLGDRDHNPEAKPAWTGAYLDPAGQGWMISCVVPVYRGRFPDRSAFLEGVTGIDVTIDSFVKNVLNINLPFHAGAFLVDQDGMILAMSEYVENILGLRELKSHVYADSVKKETLKPEDFNLYSLPDKHLAGTFKTFMAGDSPFINASCPGGNALVFQHSIPETNWRLMILVQNREINQAVEAMGRLGRNIGLLVLLLLAIAAPVFSILLSRRSRMVAASLSTPIRELSAATVKIGTREGLPTFEPTSIEEIDTLAENFHRVHNELEARTRAILDLQLRERMKEKEAELAFTAGLFESASSYLHNIGNALARMDGNIHELQNILTSMHQFPKIFTSINETDRSTPASPGSPDSSRERTALLNRFENLLVEKLKPEFQSSLEKIVEIRNHMGHSIKMQLDSFSDSSAKRAAFLQDVPVSDLIDHLLEDFRSSLEKRHITLVKEIQPGLVIRNQKHPFIHGMTNLMKNAIEAIDLLPTKESPGRIEISLRQICSEPRRLRIIIKDNGIGVDADDLQYMFQSGFTTKMGGHGLGLRSFNHFLQHNNGSIILESPGINEGTTFIVEIGDE